LILDAFLGIIRSLPSDPGTRSAVNHQSYQRMDGIEATNGRSEGQLWITTHTPPQFTAEPAVPPLPSPTINMSVPLTQDQSFLGPPLEGFQMNRYPDLRWAQKPRSETTFIPLGGNEYLAIPRNFKIPSTEGDFLPPAENFEDPMAGEHAYPQVPATLRQRQPVAQDGSLINNYHAQRIDPQLIPLAIPLPGQPQWFEAPQAAISDQMFYPPPHNILPSTHWGHHHGSTVWQNNPIASAPLSTPFPNTATPFPEQSKALAFKLDPSFNHSYPQQPSVSLPTQMWMVESQTDVTYNQHCPAQFRAYRDH
jgi:hypothetical protein